MLDVILITLGVVVVTLSSLYKIILLLNQAHQHTAARRKKSGNCAT